jgi:hypothetical protein
MSESQCFPSEIWRRVVRWKSADIYATYFPSYSSLKTAWNYIPEYRSLHNCCCGNLKSNEWDELLTSRLVTILVLSNSQILADDVEWIITVGLNACVLRRSGSSRSCCIFSSQVLLTCLSPSVVFIVVSFFMYFPPISYMHSSAPPFVLHALPISLSLTSPFKLYLEKSTSYEVPHYAVFSNLLSLLLNTLFSNTLSLCSSHNVSDQVSRPYRTTGKIIDFSILIFTFLNVLTVSYYCIFIRSLYHTWVLQWSLLQNQ